MKPLIPVVLLLLSAGCSIKRIAVNQVGNAPASGGSTFTSDDGPGLVEAAIPFGLKLYESLLAESPRHTGLLLAAALDNDADRALKRTTKRDVPLLYWTA